MFDYNTLRQYARNGNSLGSWNGRKVFSCSVLDLDNKGSGAYYMLYDDDNKIVGRDGKHFYSYGTVSESGSVSEYSSRRRYNQVCETQHNHGYEVNAAMKYSSEPIPAATAAVSYTPGYDASERPVGDVKAEIDVEKVLQSAREMSVESLLDGFLANVSFEAKG